MHCIACNDWFEETKSPLTGTYETMCHPCRRASLKEAQEGILAAEERLQRPSRDETLILVAYHYSESPKLRERYREGLGLLSEDDREALLFAKAMERAAEAYDGGAGVLACIEAAFGTRKWRGSQLEATEGLTVV